MTFHLGSLLRSGFCGLVLTPRLIFYGKSRLQGWHLLCVSLSTWDLTGGVRRVGYLWANFPGGPLRNALFLACLVPALAFAQRAENGTPALTMPLPSTADAQDVSGQEINPAALGFLQSWALSYYGTLPVTDAQQNGAGNGFFLGFGNSLGLTTGLGATILQREDDFLQDPNQGGPNTVTKLSLSLSARLGKSFAFGASAARFVADDDLALDGLTTWDAGIILRPSRYLSLAAVGYDLNTPVVTAPDGTRVVVPASFDLGLAFRPLGNEKFSLTADVGLGSAGQEKARAGLVLSPVSGLRLQGNAEVQNDGAGNIEFAGFTVGLGLSLSHIGAQGAFLRSQNGGDDFAFITARATGERYPTLPFTDDRIVEMALSGTISEAPASSSLLGGSGGKSLYSIVKRIEDAAKDKGVKAIVFRIGNLSLSAAQIEEIHRAIALFRAQGKKCYAYLDSASGRQYQLAVACDEVILSPAGTLMMAGLTSQIPFYKGGLEKLGIEPQYVRIGKYKSAPESYTETGPTAENLEIREQLLDDMYGLLVSQVASGRGLSEEKVKELIDLGPYTASEAKTAGLIDATEYYDETKKRVRKAHGVVPLSSTQDNSPLPLEWGARDAVLVVVVQGTIVKGTSSQVPLTGERLVGDETIAKALAYARESSRVKAVVLRIDSPGGDALASDLIWHEVELLKEKKKPVIVSMGSVAASGGYYIAAGADEIFADRATVTGSIGIFGGKFVFAKLYEKLGIHYATLKRGKNADWRSALRPWTEEERAAYLEKLGEFYKIFITKVSQGRGLSVEEVDALGRGKVYSGARALGVGLVTREGGLLEAVAEAKKRAGMKGESDVLFLPKSQTSLLSSLLPSLPLGKAEAAPELPAPIQEALRLAFPSALYLDPQVPWMLLPESILLE